MSDKVAGASCSRGNAKTESREQDAPATFGDNTVAGASSSRAVDIRETPREQDAPATVWEYFNPNAEIDIRTGGNLPHWEQGSVWYFVTFRLHDSLPQAVIEKLRIEKEQWKHAHDLAHLSSEDIAEYHRLFSARIESLLNTGSGSCLLGDPQVAEIVSSALGFFHEQRYVLDEFVVMPNHVHVLVKPLVGYELVDIVHSWKSFTANRINKHLGRTGQLWQHESYDHVVRNEIAMQAIRHYIRENPNVAGTSSSRRDKYKNNNTEK